MSIPGNLCTVSSLLIFPLQEDQHGNQADPEGAPIWWSFPWWVFFLFPFLWSLFWFETAASEELSRSSWNNGSVFQFESAFKSSQQNFCHSRVCHNNSTTHLVHTATVISTTRVWFVAVLLTKSLLAQLLVTLVTFAIFKFNKRPKKYLEYKIVATLFTQLPVADICQILVNTGGGHVGHTCKLQIQL